MNCTILKATRISLLMLVAFGILAGPSFAATVNLAAVEAEWTPPGGGPPVPMWAFVTDTGSCPAAPVPWSVGPKLTLAPADGTLTINLRNCLPTGSEPVSVVIPGQAMPATPGAFPVWTNGSTGPRTAPDQRVRSFTAEATAGGGTQTYTWSNFQAGTYLYETGTHPQVQVQMGLYGAVIRDAAAGQVYSGVAYTQERDLFFSEIDPDLHTAVATGAYGTTGPTSTLNYKPRYFLLHTYDGTTGAWSDATIDAGTIPPSCIGGVAQDDRVLLRMYNAGLRELSPMMIGSHYDLVAEGGKKYPYVRTQYETLLMPGSTKDAIFTPAYVGDFKLIERRLSLTDPGPTGSISGGMQTCFSVASAVEPCECDLNNDGSCNIIDYQSFIQDWGRTDCGTPPGSGNLPNDCECDINQDGGCNILDYQSFIQDWGRQDCPVQ